MKTCTCGRQLDASAGSCPQCGKTFTRPLGVIIAIAVGLIVFVAVVYGRVIMAHLAG